MSPELRKRAWGLLREFVSLVFMVLFLLGMFYFANRHDVEREIIAATLLVINTISHDIRWGRDR